MFLNIIKSHVMLMKINKSTLLCVTAILIITTLSLPMSLVFAEEPEQKWIEFPEEWGIEPKAGGTFILRTAREPSIFNPNYVFVPENEFYGTILQRLVGISAITFEPTPQLARSWEISEDYKTFTFHLFEDVTFHDGEPMTSEDVKWSYLDVLDKEGNFASQIDHIEEIETPDDNTVIFKLSRTDVTFLEMIGRWDSPVVLPKHLYEGTDVFTNPFNLHPIGTGPYNFVEWVKGSHVRLEPYLDYYLGRPFLDAILYKYIPSDAVYQLQLKTGEVHGSYLPPSFSAIAELAEEPHIVTDGFVEPGVILWVGFNLAREPYDDLRVRKAIGHAIDVYDLNEKVWNGLIYPNPYVLGQRGFPSWSFNPDAKMPEYDPAEAERLLDEAGLYRGPDGVRFSAKLVAWSSMEAPVYAEVLKEYLGEIGIECDIDVYEFVTYKEVVIVNREYDISVGGGNHGPDPGNTELFFSSTGYRNSMGYVNEEIDALFEQGKILTTIEERQPIYWRIQEIMAEELPRITVEEWSAPMPRNVEYEGYWFEEPYHLWSGNRRFDFIWWAGGEDISPPEPTPTPSPSPTPSPGEALEPRVEAVENSLNSLSSGVSSLSSEIDSLSNEIQSLQSQIEGIETPAPASNTMSYAAIALAIVALAVAYYFGTKK